MYPRLTREHLYEQVTEHIEALIAAGKLRSGDKLPPERELAEHLGVARGVVREAVKVLGARGLVTVKPGRGTFVAEMNNDSISDHLERFFRISHQSHSDLNELRSILEVEIAFLAAQRAEAWDLEQMQQAIDKMDCCIDLPREYIAADQDFHMALAKATKNQLFPLLIDVIVDHLRKSRRLIFQVPGAPERGQRWHRRIYEAVARRDAVAARKAMRQHLQQVSEDAQARGETSRSSLAFNPTGAE